jgi:hypothetical protein
MSETQRVSIAIEKHRTDPAMNAWELPPWGHPLSQGVLPLFFGVSGRLVPIGSAFTVGSGVTFVVSAAHNLYEVFDHDLRLQHLVKSRSLPEAIDLKEVAIYVLHQRWADDTAMQIDFTLWPIESFTGAPPSDVALGFPQFTNDFGTLSMPLSFDVPAPGTRLWSVGYADFNTPQDGIDLEQVRAGAFNWLTDYSHRFMVCEGRVHLIFVKRFASGYLEAPCFSFDVEIPHGLSGGPVFDTTGLVRGINSASATGYFNKPMTIASFLQPLLFKNIRVGVQLGPHRLNGVQPIIEWIMRGLIKTDGSEQRIPIGETNGQHHAGLAVPPAFTGSVYEDLNGFLNGTAPTPEPPENSVRIRPAK